MATNEPITGNDLLLQQLGNPPQEMLIALRDKLGIGENTKLQYYYQNGQPVFEVVRPGSVNQFSVNLNDDGSASFKQFAGKEWSGTGEWKPQETETTKLGNTINQGNWEGANGGSLKPKGPEDGTLKVGYTLGGSETFGLVNQRQGTIQPDGSGNVFAMTTSMGQVKGEAFLGAEGGIEKGTGFVGVKGEVGGSVLNVAEEKQYFGPLQQDPKTGEYSHREVDIGISEGVGLGAKVDAGISEKDGKAG